MSRTADDARFWDQAARKYASDPMKDMPGYERTLERARSYLRSSDVVLELGCGTGTTALRLAPHVQRIVATDVSAEMIAIARDKVAAEGCGNVDFVVGRADAPLEQAGSFDAVLAFNVLHLVPDRAAVLAHVLHVLKPGGLLISKTACLSEMNPLIRLAVPVMQRIGKAPYVAIFSGEALEHEIAAAGFTMVERARHGSGRKDPRIFLVGRKPS